MSKKLILSVAAIIILTSTITFSVPAYINYQGVLRDNAGNALTGTYSINFLIYAADTGGSPLWQSGAQSVTASNGLYTVKLGPISTASSVFTGDRRWLEVVVGTDTLTPRLEITSVAYAIRTDYATTAESAATATTATTANGLSSSATINLSGNSSGNIISTANSGSGNALYINGRLGASGCVGRDYIRKNPTNTVTVTNSNVTLNSIIITSIVTTEDFAGANETLQVNEVGLGFFKVKPMDGVTLKDIWFNYLIIN